MPTQLQRMLSGLEADGQAGLLKAVQHGIEKEGLRVTSQARVAQSGHPESLGSALTHPRITTDYSEALLEFITPVFQDVDAALEHLCELHRFTYGQIGDELIWGASMPCRIDDPSEIPIGRYGDSNNGRMKHIYRVGLESRYGRVMQSIAGIHYNFSIPDGLWPELQRLQGDTGELQDFRSRSYFGLLRNFRRYSWLLNYLFGASPALSDSFVDGDDHQLERFDDNTLYAPYATSLRMSDLGYTNQAQASLFICYNTLENYVNTLSEAVQTPYPAYEQLGVKDDQGRYLQLNTNLLQIENEYYSDIRPKRVTESGEKPLQALAARGVEYVEVRSQDINPLLPLGLDAEQSRFIDTFLLFCLLAESPEIDGDECERLRQNHNRVVRYGRQPELVLLFEDGERDLVSWGEELLDQTMKVAELLDRVHGSSCHSRSVQQQRLKLADSELTPSAQILRLMKERGQGYDEFVLAQSKQHRERLLSEPLTDSQRQGLEELARRSHQQQQQMEQAEQPPFDQFLEDYFGS
ncbi:glutamate--cysteine ligase [Motiliproteus coralliicola]|uniref:Glutamate--cysteine ligase n=1 Tax=Motiliproteus coralliicola TaxID=2283196 RepID=A0A369WCF4_9GAMM|nr:glutamate--cysteine ligase [Motiliproteus coralliicola]RDE18993.1 glutamate--cysteine ligase [Motiliproteus coralliicola]